MNARDRFQGRLLALLLVTARTGAAGGGPIMVTSDADAGPGSLRAAVEIVNSGGGDDVSLEVLPGAVIALESALPEVRSNLRLVGPAAGVVQISGQGRWPIFAFASGTTGEVSRVVLTNALATGYRHGAAISNAGVLVLRDCRIEGNRNQYGWGGGLYNRGDLTLLGCTLQANSAIGEPGSRSSSQFVPGVGQLGAGAGGGGAGFGGAIFQEAGRLSASNCVFALNRVTGGLGGFAAFDGTGTGRGGGPFGGAPETAEARAGDGGYGSGGGGAGGAGLNILAGFGGLGGGNATSAQVPFGRTGYGGGSPMDMFPSGAGGGAGMGGAVFARAGTLAFARCRFEGNTAEGGAGGEGGVSGGSGGSGMGGALFTDSATAEFERCEFVGNGATGGAGGWAPDGLLGTSPGWGGTGEGAALFGFEGQLQVDLGTLASNRVVGGVGGSGKNGGGGGLGRGGAVSIRWSEVRLTRSLCAANQAVGGGAGSGNRRPGVSGDACGGGLAVIGGNLWIENCTFGANVVRGMDGSTGSFGTPGGGGAGASLGGGIAVLAYSPPSPPRIRLRYSTVTGNEAVHAKLFENFPVPGDIPTGGSVNGGGIYNAGGRLELEAVLSAGNQSLTNADLAGPVVSLAANLIRQPGSATGLLPHDLTGLDPQLSELRYNGGPTRTYALRPGSPAVDVITAGDSPSTDQRGFSRPYGTGRDLGAVEAHPGDLPRIHGGRFDASGRWTFETSGAVGGGCLVEFSTDLQTWSLVGAVADGQTFSHAAGQTAGYYRLSRGNPAFQAAAPARQADLSEDAAASGWSPFSGR